MRAIEAVPDLVRVLEDEQELVRQVAAQALGAMKAIEALPDLVTAEKTWWIREALANIIVSMPIPDDNKVRRGQRAWFRHQMAWRFENYQYSEQLLIAERIDRLDLAASPYQDPFEPVKPSLAWRAMRLALATLAIVFILGSLPVLAIGLEIAEEIFRSLLGPTIFSWIQAYPSLAFVAFIVLGILMGLLTWWVDKLKDTLGGKTKS